MRLHLPNRQPKGGADPLSAELVQPIRLPGQRIAGPLSRLLTGWVLPIEGPLWPQAHHSLPPTERPVNLIPVNTFPVRGGARMVHALCTLITPLESDVFWRINHAGRRGQSVETQS